MLDPNKLSIVSHTSAEQEEFMRAHEAKLATPDPRIPIPFIKLHPDVTTPILATAGAVCYDLAAYLKSPVIIPSFHSVLIPTGISFRLPPYTEIQVRPRSGLSNKNRVFIPNAPGTVDWDYHGEVMVGLYNGNPDAPFTVNNGERIAQFIAVPVLPTRLEEIAYEPPSSERGESGFGSTGK